ncbi:MAG: hypothetical protein MUD03_14775 [Pirellula sp.]|nr:hypothetical protein [Pirellula sp.]
MEYESNAGSAKDPESAGEAAADMGMYVGAKKTIEMLLFVAIEKGSANASTRITPETLPSRKNQSLSGSGIVAIAKTDLGRIP